MKTYFIIIIVFLWAGCASVDNTNNIIKKPSSESIVSQSYYDTTGGLDITKNLGVVLSNDSPMILHGGNDPESDHLNMLEQGYTIIGYSAFKGKNFNESEVLQQAKKVYASVAILYMTKIEGPDLSTFGGRYLLAIGGMSAAQIRQLRLQQQAIQQFVTYWIKLKVPIFGVYVLDLSREVRQKIGSNKGVIVNAVIKDSPAFMADIVKGDIIRKFGDIDILDVRSFQEAFRQHIGQKVNILILRDSGEINKEIKLNECCSSI